MKYAYLVIINMLLFFFVVSLFSGTVVVRNNTVLDKILVGLAFGVCMMLVPIVLRFLKISVNAGSLLLMGIVITFLFFIISMYVLNFVTINAGQVDFGISGLDITLRDRTVALVVLSTVSAVFSMILETLRKSD